MGYETWPPICSDALFDYALQRLQNMKTQNKMIHCGCVGLHAPFMLSLV